MNRSLYQSLQRAIQDWVDEECEGEHWIDAYVGNSTVELMARAAGSVLEACEESQQFAEREGYIQKRGTR